MTELLELWDDEPIGAVVATAVARDGMLSGPDLRGLAGAPGRDGAAGRGVRWRGRHRGTWRRWPDLEARRAPAGRGHRGQGHRRGPLQRGGGSGRVRSIRLIPCLDVTGGRVVKGVRFVDLTDEGDPVELAARYDAEGADEVTFLDITASSDERDTMVSVVARTAEQVFIPLTVGGGVRAADDARRLLRAGADKVAVNTAAVERPAPGARHRGRVRGPVRGGGHRRPGRRPDGRRMGGAHARRADARRAATWWRWAVECAANGAGEILLTSMDRDGTRDGFDLALTRAVVDAVDIPVVASGGVGRLQDLVDGARRRRCRRRPGRVDLPPARVHHRRGQGLHGRARGHRPSRLTWNGRLRAVPCRGCPRRRGRTERAEADGG